jgi:large exoprotein involved in heme utilization and adhesion
VSVSQVGVYSGILANIPAGTSGSSGTLKIEADRLTIRNGGQLSTANLGSGIAGGIDIKAGIIDIAGASQDGQIPSRISASSASDFAAGFVQIEADRLSLADRAVLSVSSLGSGEAGNLIIRANHIQLNNGSLQAESSSGTQGNIQLTIANSLLLNHSNITTNAYGTASGGNITITAPAIVGVNNSDIIANAIQGQGGTIQITTQGLFGLKFRNKTTSESDITASSERGNNGTIQVNDFAIDFNAGLVELPAKLLDQTPITTSCNATQGSQLLLAGNGGLPPSPITYSTAMQPWRDRRDNLTARSASPPTVPSIINATAWKTSDGGRIELIASQDASPMHPVSIVCQDRGSSQKPQPKVAEFPQKR